ncbi:MAG: hypothetical protein MUC47_09465, partial [Candidatus Kapabacteria bacterium]|nr:hypothetical protein [Candidatus Kapabacteria bacterium]
MSRLDSATSYFRQKARDGGGAIGRLLTLLTLLVVGASSGLAQVTLTHVGPPPGPAGQVCSGQTPQFQYSVPIRNVVTYNVAANNGQGLLAAAGNEVDITAAMDADFVYEVVPGNINRVIGVGDFTFTYFGKQYNLTDEAFFIGSNGFVRFSDQIANTVEVDETGIDAQAIPFAAAPSPNNAVYFLNRDLEPRMGLDGENVWYEVQNVGGEDVLVVTFEDVSQYNPLLVYPHATVTVQVLLWADGGANAGRIQVRLIDFPDPGDQDPHTIGVENACGNSAFAATQDVDGAGVLPLFAHNNVDWDQANAAGQAGNNVNIGWDFTPVLGPAQTFQARIVAVGPNGIVNTTNPTILAPDDLSASVTTPVAATGALNVPLSGSFALTSASTLGQRSFALVVRYSDCTFEVTPLTVITVNPVPTNIVLTGPTNVCQGTTFSITYS